MTAGSTLTTSLPLRAWLSNDGWWRQQPLAWRMRQAWLAGLGSLNARLSAAIAGQDEAAALQDPVLIVGPWRSGTTVMHELLVAATGCATPRTWQCMNACAFPLGGPKRKAARIARPMDGLEIRDDSPQEDEFALLTLGADSAYRAFWMPHRLGELHSTLDPAHWRARPQWLAPWETFLHGVLASAGDDHMQPLILKSPNHTYRIGSIVQRFPASSFVWMLRDPTQVFLSNRKMWSAMFATHGLTPAQPGALDAFLVQTLRATAQLLSQALDRGASERWLFVSHEALLHRPEVVVDAVVERLRLPRVADRNPLHASLDRVRDGRVDRHTETLPREAQAAAAALAALHDEALTTPLSIT